MTHKLNLNRNRLVFGFILVPRRRKEAYEQLSLYLVGGSALSRTGNGELSEIFTDLVPQLLYILHIYARAVIR